MNENNNISSEHNNLDQSIAIVNDDVATDKLETTVAENTGIETVVNSEVDSQQIDSSKVDKVDSFNANNTTETENASRAESNNSQQNQPNFKSGPSFKAKKRMESEDLQELLAAGFWRRFWAYLIDVNIGFIIAGAVMGASLGTLGIRLQVVWSGVLATVICLLYFTLMTYFNNGQTLGKMIMAVRVTEKDGGKLRFSTVLVRELFLRYLHLISVLWFLYVIAAFNRKKQNLLDLFCDTVVIDENKERLYQLGQMRI